MSVAGALKRSRVGAWVSRWWRGQTGTRTETFSIFTDGSSHGIGGRPGGWAFVIVQDGRAVLEGTGGHPSTTNNVMELQAALAGLNAVLERGWHVDARVELVSDSRMTVDVARGVYLPGIDLALAQAVRDACATARAEPRWVRAHAGDPWNEYVDALAHEAKQSRVPRRVLRRAERRARQSASRRGG